VFLIEKNEKMEEGGPPFISSFPRQAKRLPVLLLPTFLDTNLIEDDMRMMFGARHTA
jgi:hypothetical protein